ncbi:MAG: aldehyde dehydrogenase [Gammaproteobacteria bacterium TMED95]|jgi:acyl-CoA reductase-like NAD-dependent aldehyde dehydrogenase|nr:aldehyde dehydrogenase family protein [Amylibacter sp.]MDA8803892.1 aldehyde dehydrogenase family protein [Amylibacter sp.]MDB2538265.1 aldehyde dehydrogenase family protein [Amylibacter sp.]OUV21600.1 MAG: aldehyde dehydrogenase [Gammaproteobacteria bacterium TMED95]|tara:strand:+ start:7792 stop:9228 length:1437 start_codon:yes stop_codon:yes gene_type:complete
MVDRTNNKSLKHFIAGQWIDAACGATFEVLNPLDDSLYAYAAKGTGDDIINAVAAAKAAFTSYKETTPTERERWLLRVAEIMEERQKDLVDCLIDEIGSPVQKAMFEFTKGLTMVRAAAGLCRNVRGETIPSDRASTFSMSIREPLGVVAVITPFNVPLIKTTRLVANALAVGNTVVHLPSEMAPHLSLIFAEIVAEAGIPDGVYNVVTGMGAEIGDDLTSHKDIDFVTFTGSTLVGQHINEICAKNKTPNTLELGGKSPTIILADADLDKVMPLAARSVFMFAGQACIASSRFYVERPLYEEFVKRFSKIIGKLVMGDLRDPNTVIAPIISLRQRERIKSHIDDARAKGANVIGGEWEGNRCQPTLLTEVSEDMSVCRTETFGPVTAIYSIENYDEGLEKANDTEYGLSSAIFTKDIDKAFHFARNSNAGMCHINGPTIHDEAHVPFGGNGESGVGREGTDSDMEAMTELKWVTVQL